MGSRVEMVGFDYMNKTTVSEIWRNIKAIIETPEGTCPGDRSYGIPQDFLSLPMETARNQAAVAVADKLETYEPRAELIEVKAETDEKDGSLFYTFVIGANEEYETDEESEE